MHENFVDLEKAFDMVPREVISWAMHKLGVEWLVSAPLKPRQHGALQILYCIVLYCTQVRKQLSEQFMVIAQVKVGIHQGSAMETAVCKVIHL